MSDLVIWMVVERLQKNQLPAVAVNKLPPDDKGILVRLKCDGTHAETSFRLSAKRTSPFKSAGTSVQLTAGSRVVRISGSNAGYTKFRGSVKRCEGGWLPTPFTSFPFTSPSCVTVCHHVSTGLYDPPSRT